MKNSQFDYAASPLDGANHFIDDDPKKQKNLSYAQINKWSDYVDANPGLKLDELYKGYSAANPDMPIDFNMLRRDLDLIRAKNMDLAKRTGSELGSYVNTGNSFPKVTIEGKDYGRVNAYGQTEKMPQIRQSIPESKLIQRLPDGVEDVWFDDKENIVKFIDPHTGDITPASRSLLNHPKVRASIEKQKADLAARDASMFLANPLSTNK